MYVILFEIRICSNICKSPESKLNMQYKYVKQVGNFSLISTCKVARGKVQNLSIFLIPERGKSIQVGLTVSSFAYIRESLDFQDKVNQVDKNYYRIICTTTCMCEKRIPNCPKNLQTHKIRYYTITYILLEVSRTGRNQNERRVFTFQ